MLSLVVALFTGISSYAASITLKVNDTGIGKVSFNTMGQDHLLDAAVNVVTVDNYAPMGSVYPSTDGYAIKSVVNETTGFSGYYTDGTNYQFYPNNIKNGDVISITVEETGGGGEDDPEYVYVQFTPDNCVEAGYVVLTDYFTNRETTYTVENSQIAVPYDNVSTFKIVPNPGYSFIGCINEADMSNPHSSPLTPALDGTFTYTFGGLISANDVLIVTCTKSGSFTVKGIGTNVANILMENQNNYSLLTISETPTQFPCGGEE